MGICIDKLRNMPIACDAKLKSIQTENYMLINIHSRNPREQ